MHACVGGTAVRDDIRTLQNGVHIVVGTPGRVYDMISRGALRLDRVGLFVLDEADEMLSRGFKDQIYDVFQYLPERVQVALFSATMPLDVLEVTNRFMPDPVRILVKKDELTLEGENRARALWRTPGPGPRGTCVVQRPEAEGMSFFGSCLPIASSCGTLCRCRLCRRTAPEACGFVMTSTGWSDLLLMAGAVCSHRTRNLFFPYSPRLSV